MPLRILLLLLLIAVGTLGATFDFTGYRPTSSDGSVTVSSTAVGISTCGTTWPYPAALLQVQTNGIYFVVNSSTATPVATDFVAVASDIILVQDPSLFRAIRSGSSDATLKVQCLSR